MTGRDEVIARYGEKATGGLDDILEHAADATVIVARGRTAYDADHLLQLAAEAVLIHIGEAAARVGPALVADHPGLGLREAIGTRNVIAHGYDIVDHAMVWETLVGDAPRLVAGIRRLLGLDA